MKKDTGNKRRNALSNKANQLVHHNRVDRDEWNSHKDTESSTETLGEKHRETETGTVKTERTEVFFTPVSRSRLFFEGMLLGRSPSVFLRNALMSENGAAFGGSANVSLKTSVRDLKFSKTVRGDETWPLVWTPVRKSDRFEV